MNVIQIWFPEINLNMLASHERVWNAVQQGQSIESLAQVLGTSEAAVTCIARAVNRRRQKAIVAAVSPA